MPDTLLVIEDEGLLRTELARHFRREGWEVASAEALDAARRLFRDREVDPLVVLTDMSLPDGNALDLLEESRENRLLGEWVFLTGYGSVPDSVRALRLGAFDFLEKPCELERLDMVVAGAARSARAQRRLREQAAAQSRKYSPSTFVGASAAARSVRNMLEKLAQVPFSALVITGESGTGKGLAARILHHAGRRSDGPLVEVNCAALPRDLLESELFGHEPGAFTGARGLHRGLLEKADQGTLFLDEVSEMPLELQVKLLKAIEDRSFRRVGGERELRADVTIIAATNRDIEARVRDGSFRGDLYHRLSVFRLELPPLGERKEDLETLVPLFIGEFNALAGKSVRVVAPETWRRLERHDWPGNVRELRNAVERCVLFAQTELFPDEWLQLRAGKTDPAPPRVEEDRLSLPLDGSMPLDAMDRCIIETALERNQGNVTRAARALGTTRETLRYRIQKYGLTRFSSSRTETERPSSPPRGGKDSEESSGDEDREEASRDSDGPVVEVKRAQMNERGQVLRLHQHHGEKERSRR
jgi:DNA-binding NtrC family response regulator